MDSHQAAVPIKPGSAAFSLPFTVKRGLLVSALRSALIIRFSTCDCCSSSDITQHLATALLCSLFPGKAEEFLQCRTGDREVWGQRMVCEPFCFCFLSLITSSVQNSERGKKIGNAMITTSRSVVQTGKVVGKKAPKMNQVPYDRVKYD